MTTRVSEYALSQYRPHAAGSTSGAPFRNGNPYDAGSLVTIDSNISWMVLESPRHLVFCAGPGTTKVTFATASAVYDGLPNFGPAPTGLTYLTYQQIPWDRRTAIRFGPFPLVLDELAADGTTIPRKVKAAVNVTHGVTSLGLYAALTTHANPQQLFNGDMIAFDSAAGVVTGTTTSFALTPATRLSSSVAAAWKCRRSPGSAASLVVLTECYLWIGWKPVGGAGTASINSITAWETR